MCLIEDLENVLDHYWNEVRPIIRQRKIADVYFMLAGPSQFFRNFPMAAPFELRNEVYKMAVACALLQQKCIELTDANGLLPRNRSAEKEFLSHLFIFQKYLINIQVDLRNRY